MHVGVWGARVVNIGKQNVFLTANKQNISDITTPAALFFLLKQEKHNNIEQQKNNGSNNIVVDETIFFALRTLLFKHE